MRNRPAASKIIVIRHAEKPDRNQNGVSEAGKSGKEHLTPRGWQRAGALVAVFAPPPGAARREGLPEPAFLYASQSSSQRSIETVTPLSLKLGRPIALDIKGRESELVDTVTALNGVVLISWQRERIPEIAKNLLAGSPDAEKYPEFWPQDRFDVFWIFDLDADAGYYRFSQMPQCLLAGDSEAVIDVTPTRETARHKPASTPAEPVPG
jgi:broad specificity phosphatase PhoE